jgi:hypothetical protein
LTQHDKPPCAITRTEVLSALVRLGP